MSTAKCILTLTIQLFQTPGKPAHSVALKELFSTLFLLWTGFAV